MINTTKLEKLTGKGLVASDDIVINNHKGRKEYYIGTGRCIVQHSQLPG